MVERKRIINCVTPLIICGPGLHPADATLCTAGRQVGWDAIVDSGR